MIENKIMFQEYNPCKENLTVKIADGSQSRVAGIIDILILKDLTVKKILHVPNMDCNLLSVNKFTDGHPTI